VAQRALEAARRAVQLDPSDVHAHRCMAWSHIMAGQYSQAKMHTEFASELNPNDSWTVISTALLTAYSGEPERAMELSRRALRLDLAPSRTHWAYQTAIQFLGGNYEASIEAADRA